MPNFIGSNNAQQPPVQGPEAETAATPTVSTPSTPTAAGRATAVDARETRVPASNVRPTDVRAALRSQRLTARLRFGVEVRPARHQAPFDEPPDMDLSHRQTETDYIGLARLEAQNLARYGGAS